jgi:hypothetical protein
LHAASRHSVLVRQACTPGFSLTPWMSYEPREESGRSAAVNGARDEGAMQLSIQVPGYQRWERALVIERAGACDYLQTLTLDVRLQRGAGS